MRNHRIVIGKGSRAAILALGLGVAAGAAGCSDFLEVTNPEAVEPEKLNSPNYVGLMVNGVIADFHPAYAWTALWSGMFVDELYNHHGYYEYPAMERRNVAPTDGTYALAIYNAFHRARHLADDAADRMKTILGDSAGRDLRLATVLAYGGFSYLYLAEQFCESPVEQSDPVPSDDLMRTAIARFDEAIAVGTAFRSANPARAAAADSIINFARVGAARGYLFLNEKGKAIEYAGQVPAAFEFYAYYVEGKSFTERRKFSNPFYEFITAGRWFSLHNTWFEAITNDPRIPRRNVLLTAADGTAQYIPNSPPSFDTYDGTLEGKPFAWTSRIRIASGFEARYITAEAQGVTPANLNFVNERRAIGGQQPLPPTASNDVYLAALREQRARDFYLDGHRLGDLRRYLKHYNLDLFPTGEGYGTQTCYPVPVSEQNRIR